MYVQKTIYREGVRRLVKHLPRTSHIMHTEPLLIEQTIIKLSNQKGEPIK